MSTAAIFIDEHSSVSEIRGICGDHYIFFTTQHSCPKTCLN